MITYGGVVIDGVGYIPLTKGQYALVDEADLPFISKHYWHTHSGDDWTFCAKGYVDGIRVKMHRLIIGAPPGMEVHHINEDPLDNRRENLLVCTKAEHTRTHNELRLERGIHTSQRMSSKEKAERAKKMAQDTAARPSEERSASMRKAGKTRRKREAAMDPVDRAALKVKRSVMARVREAMKRSSEAAMDPAELRIKKRNLRETARATMRVMSRKKVTCTDCGATGSPGHMAQPRYHRPGCFKRMELDAHKELKGAILPL
jgi:hypothetical protein